MIKVAMKAREKEKVSVLRMILSELKYELAKMEAAGLQMIKQLKSVQLTTNVLINRLLTFLRKSSKTKLKVKWRL